MFFHALTFAGSQGSCLNMRPQGQVFKRLLRDPVNVNAMKQTCIIIILAFYLVSVENRTENAGKSLKLLYFIC